jgi:regulator of protease activity HflC (stomatin/prohibitin superfamily)
VRLGKRVKSLSPGLHLCLPLLDRVHTQNSRLRVINVQTQTLSTKDNKTIIVGGTISYRITNLETLFCQLQQPEDGLTELVQERVARHVTETNSQDLLTRSLTDSVNNGLNGGERYGLSELRYYVTDYSYVRTLRLVMDQRYASWSDRIQLEPKDY